MQGTNLHSSSSYSTSSGESSAAAQGSSDASPTQPTSSTTQSSKATSSDGVFQESCKLAGKTWTFETGRLARLAHGSCLVTVGGTSVLSTAVVDPNPQREADGVPLQVGVELLPKQGAVVVQALAGLWETQPLTVGWCPHTRSVSNRLHNHAWLERDVQCTSAVLLVAGNSQVVAGWMCGCRQLSLHALLAACELQRAAVLASNCCCVTCTHSSALHGSADMSRQIVWQPHPHHRHKHGSRCCQFCSKSDTRAPHSTLLEHASLTASTSCLSPFDY